MVLLTVTPAAKAAIDVYNNPKNVEVNINAAGSEEPSLSQASIGDPISHNQLIGISRSLQDKEKQSSGQELSADNGSTRLDTLLKGSKIYTAPPKPKPEPVRTTSRTTNLLGISPLTWYVTRAQNMSNSWHVFGWTRSSERMSE